MATATIPARSTQMETVPDLYRFSVAQYLKMIEAGVFATESRLEMIEGLVVRKMVRYPPHASTLNWLNVWFTRRLPDAWLSRCQMCLELARSVPEPDIAIVRGPPRTYLRRHPRAADCLITIEVAESSLDFDRNQKGPLYAEAHIGEYWIANVVDCQVEVYTQPRGGKVPGYRQRQDYTGRTSVPVILADQKIARVPVADIFGELLVGKQGRRK